MTRIKNHEYSGLGMVWKVEMTRRKLRFQLKANNETRFNGIPEDAKNYHDNRLNRPHCYELLVDLSVLSCHIARFGANVTLYTQTFNCAWVRP